MRTTGLSTPRLSTVLQLFLLLCVVALGAGPMLALPAPQLEIDDFRYISLVQDVERDFWGSIRVATIVRNSLDHLRWVSAPFTVEYFRPMVFLSYWLDTALYADLARGMLFTNVAIYLCLTLVVWWFYQGLLGRGWSTACGVLLFSALACHSELLYYVAGRTDSCAVLCMVLALCLQAQRRTWWAAWGCYLLALGTKELTFMTPLIGVLAQWAREPQATLRGILLRDLRLYQGYAFVLTAFLIVRSMVLFDSGYSMQLAPPYAPVLTIAEWGVHVYLQARIFVESVLWGVIPQNYQTVDQFTLHPGWWLSGAAVLSAGFWLARRSRAAQVLLFTAVIPYLPLTIVYFSERYFLIPSIALAGIVSILLKRCERYAFATLASRILLTIWIAHQGLMLGAKNLLLAHPKPPFQKEPYVLEAMLTPVREQLQGEKRLLFVSVPGHWVMHLFLEHYVRVFFRDPEIRVLLLSLWPRAGGAASQVTAEFVAPGVVRIAGAGGVMRAADALAPTVSFVAGEAVQNPRTGVRVQVVEAGPDGPQVIDVTLPPAFASAPVVQFLPGAAVDASHEQQLYTGRVRVHRPSFSEGLPSEGSVLR